MLKTIAYFDVLEMPLTLDELRFFYPDFNVMELSGLLTEGKVVCIDSHYCLSIRGEDFVAQRKRRKIFSEQLLEKNKFWLKAISLLPSVNAVFVCNTLALSHANEESDIDLFIICKPGTIWSTRFLLAGFLQVFNKRPTKKSHAGKICLSFFATDNALNLNKISIKNDVYLKYWIQSLMPIYDPENYLEKIQRFDSTNIKFENNFIELALKKWQMKRLPNKIKEISQIEGSHVIVSDDMLKFHTRDRRAQIRDKWISLYEKI